MDPQMIILLVVGSIATVAVGAATMASYRDNGQYRKTRNRDHMLPREYYPSNKEIWPIDREQSRLDDYLENDDLDYLSARGSSSRRDSLPSYFNFGKNYVRDSLGDYDRSSYRRSYGGKRKSRKKI